MKSKIVWGVLLIIIGLAFICLFNSDAELSQYQSGRNIGLNALIQLLLEVLNKNSLGVIVILVGIYLIIKSLVLKKKSS
jgi:hypothetical protein